MASNFEVVTTFHKPGYDKYGKRMIETFEEKWDKSIPMKVYYENMDQPELQSDRIEYINYEETCGEKQDAFSKIAAPYEEKVLGPNGVDPRPERGGQPVTPGSRYLFEASRFAHKYYACEHAMQNAKARYLVWCDADVVAVETITEEWLNGFVQEGKYWSRIGRGNIYPECGFMIWDTQHSAHQRYWQLMSWLYDQGALFQLVEWHDSYVWWTAERYVEQEAGKPLHVDLGGGHGGHAFVKGPLGAKLDHLKGNRKDIGFSKERLGAHK
jgi:hypothetical protein